MQTSATPCRLVFQNAMSALGNRGRIRRAARVVFAAEALIRTSIGQPSPREGGDADARVVRGGQHGGMVAEVVFVSRFGRSVS